MNRDGDGSSPTQLQYILQLLDDPTPSVQKALAEALVAFGSDLEVELKRLEVPPTPSQTVQIQRLLAENGVPEVVPLGSVYEGRTFVPGQLVRHGRYNYRGVVVAADAHCRADDDWYLSNRTQPDRNQPWYHVLVHGGQQVTYAAHTSLLIDTDGTEIDHPLVPHFFDAFVDGRYNRNDTPWPDE